MAQKINDVFISYSRKDYVDENKQIIPGNKVLEIKEALTTAGINFWMDEKGIIPGEDYAAKITKHIKACNIFLYISSENANQSDWTRKEIATALLYKKYIIPLLLDDSPFHDSVILRIADLERIDYYVNPQQGLEKLLSTLKAYLEELAAEERRKKEEEERRLAEERRRKEEEEKARKAEQERKRQEEEARKKAEEQEALVKQISETCTQLNSEESKLESRHNELLLLLAKISDPKKQESLRKYIDNSSPIRKTLIEQNNEFKEKMVGLNEAVKTATSQRDSLSKELEREREKRTELEDISSQSRRYHFIYASVIGVLILIFGYWIYSMSGTVSSLKDEVALKQDTIEIQRKNVEEINKLGVYEKRMSSVNKSNETENYTYTGSVDAEGRPHGNGRATFSNGDVFEGLFQHGVKISGKRTYHDGYTVEGNLDENEQFERGSKDYYIKIVPANIK